MERKFTFEEVSTICAITASIAACLKEGCPAVEVLRSAVVTAKTVGLPEEFAQIILGTVQGVITASKQD